MLTCALLCAGIALMLGLMIRQAVRYNRFRGMWATVDHQGFYEGTVVDGQDISGWTLDQALSYWEETIEPQYAGRTLVLSSGEYYSSDELGYESDYRTVLNNAWNNSRKGTLSDRYQAVADQSGSGAMYTVTRTLYTQQALEARALSVAQTLNYEPVNATLAGFDVDTMAFTFNESAPGNEVNQPLLIERMIQAIEQGGGAVTVPIDDVPPQIPTENVAAQYGCIASASTDASSSDANRLENIRRAAELINGTRVEKGKKFSFNDTVGQRTEERGFLMAHAYGEGNIIDEVGGGICQVSTTLFNAAVMSDMKIVERHPHSMTVAYIDRGRDATVNWRSKDFIFTNTSDDAIYVIASVGRDKQVRVSLFGKLLPDGMSITVDSETTETYPFTEERRANPELKPGKERVVREGRDGYQAVAYRVTWDASGEETTRTVLCTSTYSPVSKIIEYGPKED